MIERTPLSRHRRVGQFEKEVAMAKVDNLLMFSCLSAFFAGLVYAVMTLPV
jgi:hypothetical protein